MSVLRPGGQAANGQRRCAACDSILATDNTANLCSRCHRDQRDQLRTPPQHLWPDFFETDEFRVAFESQHIGRVFKAYRNHPRHLKLYGKSLNQEHLGRWIGLTQAQVSKLENGKAEQNLETLRRFAEILCLPRNLLWFDFPGERRVSIFETQQTLTPMLPWQNPTFESSLRQHGKLAGAALVALAASESATFGLRHLVSEIHASTMEQIEEEVHRLSVDFVASDPLNTFVRSRKLRDDIFTLLDQRVFPQQERLLSGFAARTCGYLAAASSDFYGSYDAAADQCRVARRFSDMADFAELRAWILGIESGISFWRGEWKQAANLAERSLELAVTRSGVMRASSMRARALARLGDKEGLQAAIRASEVSSIDSTSDEENGMILFSEDNHLRCIGTANLWVDESRKAREQLTQALDAYLAGTPENYAVIAVIRADIALSLLMDRDIDGAAIALAPLLEIEADLKLEGTLRRVRHLDRILQSEFAGSTHARDLTSSMENFLVSARQRPKELPEGK